MLRFFRERGNSWILKGFLGVVALTFISWGGFTMVQGPAVEGGRVAAWVNDSPITLQEYEGTYARQVEALRRQLGAQFKDELLQQLGVRQQVLAGLVSQKLQLQEAGRLGIRVSDAEVALRIQGIAAFQRGGRFDPGLYRQVLESNRLSPRQFEEDQRVQIATERLRRYIGMAATVSEAEVQEAYRLVNEQIKLAVLPLAPVLFEKEAAVTEKDLADHYEKNKEQFRLGPQRKAQWWYLSYDAVRPGITAAEEELRARYDQTRARYAVADEVELSQVFLPLVPDAKPEQVEEAKKKLEGLRDQARKGADFAALAKAESRDPSASRGGDMGSFKRGEMVPGLERMAFALKAGEVGEPVRTSFGYHLVKVRERRYARQLTFEEAKAEVEKDLRELKAKAQARNDLRAVRYAIEDKKPAPAAQGLSAGDTGFFAQESPPPVFPEREALASLVFRLAKKGDLSSEAEGEKGVLFARLVDMRDSHIPPFEQVAEDVRKKFVEEKSLQIARAKAEGWLKELSAGKRDLAVLAKELNVKLLAPEPFSRARVPQELSAGPEAIRALFRLKKGEVGRVFSGRNVWLVLCDEPASADMAKFGEQKESLRTRLAEERQRLLFLRHMEALRQASKLRMEKGFNL